MRIKLQQWKEAEKKIGESARVLVRFAVAEFPNLGLSSLLAILPDEDGRPGEDAGQEPPRRLEDQKKEKDPGTKS